MKLTPAASIFTSTCPAAGAGCGVSSNRSTSTPPGACTRIAFILMLSSLPVDRPHSPFRVAVAGGGPFGRDAVDASPVGRSEMNGGGRDVLRQVAPPLGAGDGNDVRALRKQPGERRLRRPARLLLRQLLDPGDEVQVLREVRALEARVVAAPIILRQVVERFEPPGEEPAPQRAVRHESDAQLPARRQNLVLGIPRPQ